MKIKAITLSVLVLSVLPLHGDLYVYVNLDARCKLLG